MRNRGKNCIKYSNRLKIIQLYVHTVRHVCLIFCKENTKNRKLSWEIQLWVAIESHNAFGMRHFDRCSNNSWILTANPDSSDLGRDNGLLRWMFTAGGRSLSITCAVDAAGEPHVQSVHRPLGYLELWRRDVGNIHVRSTTVVWTFQSRGISHCPLVLWIPLIALLQWIRQMTMFWLIISY